jgi:predicted dehydrogenase
MVRPYTSESNQQHRINHHAVVVEKPFTTTSAEADALIATSKETNKLLTVFQNRRYDSDFRTLQRVLSTGCLGAITEFQNNYDLDDPEWVRGWTSETPSPGEGMLYGLGTHSLDQTLLLFGQPCSVTAFTRALRQKGVASDDCFTVVLQYEGYAKEDLVCTVKTTIVSRLPMERQVKFVVRGRDGTFLKVSISCALRVGSLLTQGRTAKTPKLTNSSLV